MASKPNKSLKIQTPRHELKVDCYYDLVNIDKIKTDKKLFTKMCRKGCKNFNKKYCCPPHPLNFYSLTKNYNYLLVVLFKVDLNQLSGYQYRECLKLRIANAVIKSRVEKVMRSLEDQFNGKFLGTGACRLCKPCQKKMGKPCKHPKKMRFSLESIGVDCNRLTEDVFGFPLLWYKKKKAPEYTAVICALPIKNKKKEKLYQLADKKIDTFVV